MPGPLAYILARVVVKICIENSKGAARRFSWLTPHRAIFQPDPLWTEIPALRLSVPARFLLGLVIIMQLSGGSISQAAEKNPANSDSFFRQVLEKARATAQAPYKPRVQAPLPEQLDKLNYDQYQQLSFVPERAPWANEKLPFALQFMPRGYLFKDAAQINLVEPSGARRFSFDPAMFKGMQVPPGSGELDFAGLRILWRTGNEAREIASFLGASYFRFIGLAHHYGSSARGLAIDTAEDRAEEFPRFTEFWVKKPENATRTITLYALMESPSVTGAYTLQITPGSNSTMRVSAAVFVRDPKHKFGMAPLTSMFLAGENRTRIVPDLRPEVHDCDGLLVLSSDGHRQWRPVHNPEKTRRITRVPAGGLAGFGLLQRDREFNSYVDLEANYQMRPGFWVRPLGDWGKGHVELVELPTPNEYNDNIVAFWVPDGGLPQGGQSEFSYEISTLDAAPSPRKLLEVEATRMALQHDDKPPRVVIDFRQPSGHSKTGLISASVVKGTVTTSQGEITNIITQTNRFTGGWRLFFDLASARGTSADLQATLEQNGAPISETWLYSFQQP